MNLIKNKIFLLKACRPNQWTKNLIIFSAPLFNFKYSSEIWIPSIYTTLCFCLISSAIYLINDVLDIESDKKHPVKCYRPIASGKITIGLGVFYSVILCLLALFILLNFNLKHL